MEEPLLTKTVQYRGCIALHRKKRGCAATAHHHTMPLYTTVDTLTTTHYWTEEGPNETLLFLAAAVTAHCDKICHKSILKPFELYLSYAAEVLIFYHEKCLLLVRNDKNLWDPQNLGFSLVWFSTRNQKQLVVLGQLSGKLYIKLMAILQNIDWNHHHQNFVF